MAESDFNVFIDSRVSDLYAELASSDETPGQFLRRVATAELNERAAIVEFLRGNRDLTLEALIDAVSCGFHR